MPEDRFFDVLLLVFAAIVVAVSGLGLFLKHRRRALSLRSANEDKGRILIAEDVDMNRRVIKAQLDSRGYDVTTARNGAEAVALLRRRKFDLVLMDVEMPKLNGIQATEIIREELNITNRDMPIIALTSHAQGPQFKACLEAGMDDFVNKPVTTDTLYAKVDEWLNTGDADPFLGSAMPEEKKDHHLLLDENQLRDFIRFVGLELAVGVYGELVRDCRARLDDFHRRQALDVTDLHNLSSISGNLGLNRLTEFCNATQAQIKSGATVDLQLVLGHLEIHLGDSIKAFEQYLMKSRDTA